MSTPTAVPTRCPGCRRDTVSAVGDELARCTRCGSCFGWNYGLRRWERLASLFVGSRLTARQVPLRPGRNQ